MEEQTTPAVATTATEATWYPETEKTYVETKAWKTPVDAINSYKNLEKLQRTPIERTVVLPEKADDVEGWKQVRARLGTANPAYAPVAKPEEYAFEGYAPVEGQPDLIQGENGFAAKAHELGLSKHDANELFKWYSQQAVGYETQTAEQKAETHAAGLQQVKTAWGAAYDQNVGIAKHAVASLGIEAEALERIEDAMGTEWLMQTFHRIGKQFGEHGAPPAAAQGTREGFAISPAEAQEKVNELLRDDSFIKRYMNGDKDALSRMEKLHQSIAGTALVRPNSLIAR